MLQRLMFAFASAGIIPDGELIDLMIALVRHVKKHPIEKRMDALKKAIRNAMDDAPRVYDAVFVEPKKGK